MEEKSNSPRKKSKFTQSIHKESSESDELFSRKLSRSDFKIQQIIGKGSYAKVCLAEYRNKKYALKVIDKKFIEKIEKVHEVHIEKQILTLLDHPRIIKLHSTFQDSKNLYFVLDYCPNKDLSEFLHSQGSLSHELIQFYSAEIVSALEYLRSQGISHRDLKPENIILDEDMMIKIIDFSTATRKGFVFDRNKKMFVEKKNSSDKNINIFETMKIKNNSGNNSVNSFNNHLQSLENQTLSLVGTAEYVSPEALNSEKSATSEYYGSDLWALGCIIYKFFEGTTPFKDNNDYKMFEKIITTTSNDELHFSESTPIEAKDLIKQLLNPIAEKRIGYDNIEQLKNHMFFDGIDFANINKLPPPKDDIILLLTSRKLNKQKSDCFKKSSVNNNTLSFLEAIAEINNSGKEKDFLNEYKDCKMVLDENEKNLVIHENYIQEVEESKTKRKIQPTYSTSNIMNFSSLKYKDEESTDEYNPKEAKQKKSNNFEISRKSIKRLSDELLVLECKIYLIL